jgi:hypothetical protein
VFEVRGIVVEHSYRYLSLGETEPPCLPAPTPSFNSDSMSLEGSWS